MQLLITNVPALEASEARLVRSLGAPTEWRFSAKAQRDTRAGEAVPKIAAAVASARPAKAHAEGTDGGLSRSGPPATIVGVSWREGEVDLLDIYARGTEVATQQPSPFVPRRRVHRVKTMQDLIKKFTNVCLASSGVLTEMGDIEFPDGDHTSIIQDGVSDWQFVGQIMDQCLLLRPSAHWLPLTLMGGVAPTTAGKWVITPGRRRAYESWGAVQGRQIRFEDGHGSDGFGHIEFGSMSTEWRSISYPHGIAPGVVYWRQERKFDDGEWQNWSTRDLPLFTQDGGMIWKIEDILHHSGQVSIVWESRLWVSPPDTAVSSPIQSSWLRAWTGLGKVKARESKSCWVTVELAGFESEENTADLRLTTSFSGADGRKGVHLVPEAETEVECRWSGRFDTSIVLGGNVRSQDALFDSPSAYFEEKFTGQYADVRVPRVGQVTVESNFGMGVQQATDISSTQQFHVKADGADWKMNGGVVYTGRGM